MAKDVEVEAHAHEIAAQLDRLTTEQGRPFGAEYKA